MKRLLSVVCLLALLLSWGLPCSAQTVGFDYIISDGQVTITGCDTSISGALVVPEVIEGCPVTTIGEFAFVTCVNLTSVTLPDSVTAIGDYAFWGCENLETVILGKATTSIDEGAFAYCHKLTEINLPEGISVLPKYLFLQCHSLQSITIPDSVTVIGEAAFNDCNSLLTVNIPQGVSVISKSTFACCYNLTRVTLPDSVTIIEDFAFSHCFRLSQVAAPEVFAFVDSLVGFNLPELKGIVMPSKLTSIGESAFSYCYELWYVVFPGDVVSFGENCFEGTSPSIYYHAGNDTWTEDVLQDYGGTPMWFGIHGFFNYVSDDNATCTADGTMTAKCEFCEATDTIPDTGSKGHRYVDGVCTLCGSREHGLVGDVNGDGKVNMKDWNLLYAHITEQSLLTGNALALADVTGDGKINMKDWNRLYDHISEVNPLW